MECSFGHSANFVVPENQNILAHCPIVRKVLFLPEFRPLEGSTGRVECLTDEPWVFWKSGFLRKTITKYKVLPPSKEFLIKFFLWSHGLCFWHHCWKLLPQIWNFFSQNQKRLTNLFFFSEKNPFVSNPFSGLMECGVNNSAKNLSPTNQHFFAHCP